MNSLFRTLTGTTISRKSLILAVLAAIGWLLFWYWPWQTYLQSFTWLKLGIGLILFVIPGACVYGLLTGRSDFTLSHITFGFVISHLLIAMLGTLGRVVHLSFEAVKLLMVLTGLIFTLRYLLPKIQAGYKIDLRSLKTKQILPILLLLLVSGMACLVVIQRVIGDDDLTYLAYVTNWQNSIRLDFKDILFGEPEIGTSALLDHERSLCAGTSFRHQ